MGAASGPALPGDAVQLRVGADYRETEGRTQERFFFVGGVPTRQREAGGLTRTVGGFAEITVQASPDLTLTGSGRLDRWWIENGFFRQGNNGGPLNDQTLFADRGDWRATGRAGVMQMQQQERPALEAPQRLLEGGREDEAATRPVRMPCVRPRRMLPIRSGGCRQRASGLSLCQDADPIARPRRSSNLLLTALISR